MCTPRRCVCCPAPQIERDEEIKKALEWVREMYAFSVACALEKVPLEMKVRSAWSAWARAKPPAHAGALRRRPSASADASRSAPLLSMPVARLPPACQPHA